MKLLSMEYAPEITCPFYVVGYEWNTKKNCNWEEPKKEKKLNKFAVRLIVVKCEGVIKYVEMSQSYM